MRRIVSCTMVAAVAATGALVAEPVRVNVRLSEAPAEGRTIYEYDPRSRGASDYAMLVERLSALWHFEAPTAPRSQANGQVAHPQVPSASVPVPRPASVAPAEPQLAERPPMVTGVGSALQMMCPNCGRLLKRATVAGYRVAYCDTCKYRQQDLVRR